MQYAPCSPEPLPVFGMAVERLVIWRAVEVKELLDRDRPARALRYHLCTLLRCVVAHARSGMAGAHARSGMADEHGCTTMWVLNTCR
eukprot:364298-Chlamydomonas_euryale.AAC.12